MKFCKIRVWFCSVIMNAFLHVLQKGKTSLSLSLYYRKLVLKGKLFKRILVHPPVSNHSGSFKFASHFTPSLVRGWFRVLSVYPRLLIRSSDRSRGFPPIATVTNDTLRLFHLRNVSPLYTRLYIVCKFVWNWHLPNFMGFTIFTLIFVHFYIFKKNFLIEIKIIFYQ